MAESAVHQSLVRAITGWVTLTCGNKSLGCICVDCPEANPSSKPPVLGGFVPDLYCRFPGEDRVIVGEAKTASDVESKHTIEQLSAFLFHCESCCNGLLVVAVPWHLTRLTRTIINQIIVRQHYLTTKFLVLDQLEG